ncbi:MAG: hypothetical protein OQK12_10550 [Motiliproteus sp.]|nr:hypothetical protein [Motiliproteus sp.]MCW9051103.1 hypothetical protein [Motiliproteus sp.]
MNWVIIILLLLSVVGSMMWMMPSPKQKVQALLRQQAMRTGIQVQMVRLLFPREIGESIPDERDCIAYRLPRTNAMRKDKKTTIPWQIFKLESHATTGLPDGWCWSKGEYQLSEEQLQQVGEIIAMLPADGYSLESTPIAVSLFWYENGTEESVEKIHQILQLMLEKNI